MNDFSKYSKVIILDNECRPMAWGGDQLCYCTDNTWQDPQFPVRVYTKKYAKELINRTILFRKKNKLSPDNYKLMPVAN